MKSAPAAYQFDGRPASREAFYAGACDPRRHVVVEACAGAGKTWMLVARIVRALVEGAEPQDILAITFTRKAAGEMRTRLADWLRKASHLTPGEATAQLLEFGVPPQAARDQAGALIGLHERVLHSGRAVEVRTFHAWYTQLLRAAPMDLLADLGLAPDMTPLEDISDLKPALMRAFHAAVLADEALRRDYTMLSLRHGRFLLDAWFAAALSRRAEIELADAAGVLESSVEPGPVANSAAQVRDAAFAAAVQALAGQLAKRDKYRQQAEAAAKGLIDGLALADDRAAYDSLRAALFTEKGTPRKQLGDLPAQAALCDVLDRIGLEIAQADAQQDHAAMTRLSRRLFAEYANLKRRRGLIDMADLERVALALLSDHALSGWIQERLDARVRHLLIDEFQDTSPLQWHALHGWLAAYAGAGGGGEGPRLFIVGDPKQSIYRFRRAEPRVFEAAQHFVVEALGGSLAACDHTRRCAPGVVAAINAVFGAIAEEGQLPSWRDHSTEIGSEDAEARPVARLASAERPPREPGSGGAEAERHWRPSLTTPRIEARLVLREAEAGEVARAIQTLLRTEGVAPQDIMVLARKRSVLAQAADALAALHLPHVAPEDLRLAEGPEVQDLLAVLDVLASPGQALSLARALKSPLFGASDADLLALAAQAREAGGWWPALLRLADERSAPQALQRAARLFAQWQLAARTLPPHDLLDRIVDQGELLPHLAAVVPPERHTQAMEAVRALLAAALELDGGRYASPYNFVRALRQRHVLAPPAQRSDAVRLLTIHGAKGLEARIVFLMDADPEPPRVETATLLIDWPVEAAQPQRVAFVASEARCPPSLQALLADEQAARAREEFNALYVALTRAEQRLVVSRTPPRSTSAKPSWWARLEGLAQAWAPAPPSTAAVAGATQAEFVDLALGRRGAPVPVRVRAVHPARDDRAARLGQALHRTLEWAARAAPGARAGLAGAAAAEFGVVDAGAVEALATRILNSPACARFFDAAALAWAGNEVPVAGVGAQSGQVLRIDRLVCTAGEARIWWVLDYKLDGTPQGQPELLEQLDAYRDAVQALQPGERVRAAFITGTGELVEPA
jgi:ATP-dependent helicase/nuclease subunit A